MVLYIPFWIYSNKDEIIQMMDAETLYIPFWIYSNDGMVTPLQYSENTLHSILDIFQSKKSR